MHDANDASGTPGPAPAAAEAARRRWQEPDNEVPGSAAVDALLAATDDLVVFICGMSVFRHGVDFTVEARARPGHSFADRGISLEDAMGPVGEAGNRLLLGIEFADGRRCSNVEREPSKDFLRRFPTGVDPSSDQPSLWSKGGGSGSRSMSVSWFLAPLPPPGDLRIICAWPAAGLPETATTLSTDAILQAASRARELWPWEPEPKVFKPAPVPPPIPEGGWFDEDLPADPGH
jgi:hypothetical protein